MHRGQTKTCALGAGVSGSASCLDVQQRVLERRSGPPAARASRSRSKNPRFKAARGRSQIHGSKPPAAARKIHGSKPPAAARKIHGSKPPAAARTSGAPFFRRGLQADLVPGGAPSGRHLILTLGPGGAPSGRHLVLTLMPLCQGRNPFPPGGSWLEGRGWGTRSV